MPRAFVVSLLVTSHSPDLPLGPAGRRGALAVGERVQLTDPKGRLHTVTLAPGATFQTHRGSVRPAAVIGRGEGVGVTTSGRMEYLVRRPLLAHNVPSMPRRAAGVYPKPPA